MMPKRFFAPLCSQPAAAALVPARERGAGGQLGRTMLAALGFSLAAWGSAHGASLEVGEGVVVKFGSDAALVVRERLVAGKGVVLTSTKDDTVGGSLSGVAAVGAAGQWRGLRIEKSAGTYGALSLNDWTVRYAGAALGSEPGAGLTIRAWAPSLSGLVLSGNTIGLRLLDAASPNLSNLSFVQNGTGISAEGGSQPVVSASQLVGNTGLAINNQTPANAILATGNWWGDASGPLNAATNPQGLGNAVSNGVNFGSALAVAPLLNPSVRLAAPAAYFEQTTVMLDIACINATEYRIAESAGFAGVAFEPLANGRAQVPFTTSSTDGVKAVTVQFRDAAGTIATATLSGGVRIDSLAPALAITNPAVGSVISQSITIGATATDGGGVASVAFYVDGALKTTDTSAPYSYAWNIDGVLDGEHSIRVVATDAVGHTSEQTTVVTLTRVPLAPDTEGPALSGVKFSGVALANGAVITANGSVTLNASDRSGIARVELLLDGAVVSSATGTTSFTAPLNIDAVANGPHTLGLRAVDSLGNVSDQNYTVSVAHALPAAPQITSPSNGMSTRDATVAVAGTAQVGTTVQLLSGGQPQGSALGVASNGRFAGSVDLLAGVNTIQAQASNAYGVSTLSAVISVTRDTTVPSSPSNLSALAQASGVVKLSWNRSTDANTLGYHVYRSLNSFALIGEATRVSNAPLSANSFDDLPPSDNTWTYRVVAVNAAGTSSEPTNSATAASDSIAPAAVSIVYSPLGKTDPTTGRIGQGQVNLVLTTNEALQTTPYLSLVPDGGAPIVVALSKTGDTTYSGSFFVTGSTPSGIANTLFSARDAVGNRGTVVQSGATLNIDTQGPVLSTIALTPGAPIRAESAPTVQAVFTFSKAPSVVPQLRYLLSGASRAPVDITVSAINATTFSGSFTLPADAGLASPETLSFRQQSKDDLDNVSAQVAALNQFQVYQGDLPPLDTPIGLTAKAQPGGKVRLSWQAVDGVSSYQIYRQAPGETSLEPLLRSAGVEYIDSTPADGTYLYAVASVRESNGQEGVSGQTAPVSVTTIAIAPGAPQNLTLTLTGRGIYAAWQPPLASAVDHYRLYRSTGTAITSIDGLTPIKTLIKEPQTYDTSPSPTQGAYVVTAVDAAGNESAMSNSAYLNASLLPVRNLKVEQLGNALPTVSWTAPNGNVAGYLVYVGPDATKVQVTPTPIVTTSFVDSGFTSGERRYTVAAVDANGVEIASVVLLPNVSSQIVSGLPVLRGIMNRLQVQVSNTSASALSELSAVVRLPVNIEGTVFKEHRSETISLAPNETRLMSVVVGGYAELPGAPTAQVGIELAPVDGATVKLTRNQAVEVGEGTLVVGMTTEAFTRGATGQLKLSIENTSNVDVELLTATSNGANPSTELRFKIIDADGNVLATQPFKQVFGAGVITLTNGQTVARIPAGSSYVSDVFELNVPAASPSSIRVQLEVDKLRYHSGQTDEILIAGRGSEKAVSLGETPYIGEVTNVAPISSFGDQDVVITGRATERGSNSPMANTRLKLVLNQQGFERTFQVLTDGTGTFNYTFKPTVTDAGLFKVSAVHPDITDRPEQKSFTINRVTVTPAVSNINLPKNYPFTLPFKAKAGAGTSATNLRLVLNAVSQPTGEIPAGVSVNLASPVNLSAGQTLNVPAIFNATNESQPSGALVFDVVADENPNTSIGKVRVNYTLSESAPFLVSTPGFVETGLAQGSSQVESVTYKNNGLQEAINLQFSLSKPDGSAVPAWVAIASQANGTLAIGESRTVDLSFTPPTGLAEGVYEFALKAVGDNVPAQTVRVYASVTQSGQGNVLFKAADIYTATVDKNGQLIQGLAGATITLQNEDVSTITVELVTDALGEALFQNIPSGSYKFRAKANNHQELAGRLQVKPGITFNQPLFLNYNLITVEWSVREITIQDRYDITLSATFETDVPAAVVVMQPQSVNLPAMAAGDVYFGELSLTNHGLVRAEGLNQTLPRSDAFFRFEFLTPVPETLEAKQRVTLPYRVVALQSLESAASGANSSGGGCYNYGNSTAVQYGFKCANGELSSGVTSTNWFAFSNSTCSGPTSTPVPWTPPRCMAYCGDKCCGSGGGGGGGGGGSSGSLLGGPRCVAIPRGGFEVGGQCQ